MAYDASIQTWQASVLGGLSGGEQLARSSLSTALQDVASWIDKLRQLLLFDLDQSSRTRLLSECIAELKDLLANFDLAPEAIEASTQHFFSQLPGVQSELLEDVNTAYKNDPAAQSKEVIILCYPGLLALVHYRLARQLLLLNQGALARLVTELGHSASGIDIHPGAKIGRGLFIDHGSGVVIGESAVIGNDVTIYQGVTLGAKSFPRTEHGDVIKGRARHPQIEDRVTIYAGATLLGRITVGSDSVIGGNVWLTRSVPAFSRVTQQGPTQESFSAGSGI